MNPPSHDHNTRFSHRAAMIIQHQHMDVDASTTHDEEGVSKRQRQGFMKMKRNVASGKSAKSGSSTPTPTDAYDEEDPLKRQRREFMKHLASGIAAKAGSSTPTPTDAYDEEDPLKRQRREFMKHVASRIAAKAGSSTPTSADASTGNKQGDHVTSSVAKPAKTASNPKLAGTSKQNGQVEQESHSSGLPSKTSSIPRSTGTSQETEQRRRVSRSLVAPRPRANSGHKPNKRVRIDEKREVIQIGKAYKVGPDVFIPLSSIYDTTAGATFRHVPPQIWSRGKRDDRSKS